MVQDGVLSNFPDWFKTGYNAAQSQVANSMSGQDLTDGLQRQDDVVWGYWNAVRKAPGGKQWHEDWFFSDNLPKAKAASAGAGAKGLDILKTALASAKSDMMKAKVLGAQPVAPTQSGSLGSDKSGSINPDAEPTPINKGKQTKPSAAQDTTSDTPDTKAGTGTKAKASIFSKIPTWGYALGGGILVLGVAAYIYKSQQTETTAA